jgi:hypothetical protein
MVKMPNTANSTTAQEYQASLAENSRPGGLAWRAKKVGKRRGKVAKRGSRVNWFHKLIWPHIHQAAEKFRFSAVQTVRFLQQKDVTISRLDRHLLQTVHLGLLLDL